MYLKTQQSFARDDEDTQEVEKIEKWFDRLEKALQDLFEEPKLQLKFNRKELDFYIQHPDRLPYTLNQLSAGYSAVLDVLINILMRMEKTATTAYDVEGIVLIDEIETHLHIQLQKKILPFLTSFFPKIQFIVTTHSPFVINSIENAVIYDLEKQIQVENLSGVAYSGVVEGYFDIGEYSTVIQEKLDKYELLAFKDNKNEDEESEVFRLRRYLKHISMQLSPEVVLRFNQIEQKRKHRG